jgi:hypothetical protein
LLPLAELTEITETTFQVVHQNQNRISQVPQEKVLIVVSFTNLVDLASGQIGPGDTFQGLLGPDVVIVAILARNDLGILEHIAAATTRAFLNHYQSVP